jgi:predicted GTPase
MKRIIYSQYRKDEVAAYLQSSGKKRIDILFIGATGAGKSTTLNSIVTAHVADIGTGTDPETAEIKKYHLNSSIKLWDTPGLGDSTEKDQKYEIEILKLLHTKKTNADGSASPLIDLVVLIVDGSSREMGTTFRLLTGKLQSLIGKRKLLVFVNQADCAMHTHEKVFNKRRNQASSELTGFLEEKASSVMTRISESTGFSIIKPLCYSAKYGFNVKKVFDRMLDTVMGNPVTDS